MKRLTTTTTDDKIAGSDRPGLLDYLEERLGRSTGHGAERSFHCHQCLKRLGDESSKKKLGINISKGVACCFRCGYRAHNLEQLFRDMNKGALRLIEARIIAGEAKLPQTTLHEYIDNWLYGEKDSEKKQLKPQPRPKEAVPIDSALGRPGYRYLVNRRGLDPEMLDRHNVCYCPDGDYANRVIFPVIQNGAEVYFTSRYCGNGVANKAKNPPNQEGFLKKTDIIWNYDGVRGEPIIAVCEGAISAMAFSAGVALLGKDISDAQLAMLTDLVNYGLQEVIVAMDSDAGEYSERIFDRVSFRVPECSILYFDKGDPDERRDDLATLLETRTQPTFSSRVSSQLRRRTDTGLLTTHHAI